MVDVSNFCPFKFHDIPRCWVSEGRAVGVGEVKGVLYEGSDAVMWIRCMFSKNKAVKLELVFVLMVSLLNQHDVC